MAKHGFFHVNVGSGEVVSEKRDVRDFDSVRLSGSGTIFITQTGEESLSIEAEESILPLLTSEVHGHQLELGVRHGVNIAPRASIHYYLTVRDLRGLAITGAGKVQMSSLTTDTLRVTISGAGDLQGPELTADTLDISISGAGKVMVNSLTTNALDVTIPGTGSATLAGRAARQTVTIPGAGSYHAEELVSDQARVKVSGAGSAIVNVRETLDARISGIGSIRYAGQPTVTKSVSGIGSIRPLNG